MSNTSVVVLLILFVIVGIATTWHKVYKTLALVVPSTIYPAGEKVITYGAWEVHTAAPIRGFQDGVLYLGSDSTVDFRRDRTPSISLRDRLVSVTVRKRADGKRDKTISIVMSGGDLDAKKITTTGDISLTNK